MMNYKNMSSNFKLNEKQMIKEITGLCFGAGHSDQNTNKGPTGYKEGLAMRQLLFEIADAFKEKGYEIGLVRSGEDNVTFSTRAKQAYKAGAIFYISLHTDATSGVKVLHSVRDMDKVEIANKIGREIADSMGLVVKYIKARPSAYSTARDYYGVLRNAKDKEIYMPMIVEHGGHGDVKEEQLLKRPETFKIIAKAYVSMYEKFFRELVQEHITDKSMLKGSNYPEVAYLQKYLDLLGYTQNISSFYYDGIFGKKTKMALEAFQKSKDLKTDGVFSNIAEVLYKAIDERIKRIDKDLPEEKPAIEQLDSLLKMIKQINRRLIIIEDKMHTQQT